jgi:hypothetical protein
MDSTSYPNHRMGTNYPHTDNQLTKLVYDTMTHPSKGAGANMARPQLSPLSPGILSIINSLRCTMHPQYWTRVPQGFTTQSVSVVLIFISRFSANIPFSLLSIVLLFPSLRRQVLPQHKDDYFPPDFPSSCGFIWTWWGGLLHQ